MNARSADVPMLEAEEAGSGSSEALSWMASVFAGWRGSPFAIRLWSGETWRTSDAAPAFTIVVGAPSTLARIALGVDLEVLGDELVAGRLEVEGDLLSAFSLARQVREAAPALAGKLGAVIRGMLVAGLSEQGSSEARVFRSDLERGSTARARDAVNFHYELPHEFFRLFLDEQDVYSCAYFRSAATSLEAAQIDKLEHVCRKLRLVPGDEVLDLGCGWGALAIHAARYHGARVLGITLSELMAGVARERAARAGVSGRCRIEVRNIKALEGAQRFDKIASVGSIEHVPLVEQAAHFRRCFELLRPGGRMLLHGITAVPSRPLAGGNRFLRKYVFPDHEIVPVHASLALAQAAGFEVRDVESLREHYALTLATWYRRLEARAEDARRIVGETVHRVFRVYLAGMSRHFEDGGLDLHQTLLAKSDGGRSGLPLTRSDLYRP